MTNSLAQKLTQILSDPSMVSADTVEEMRRQYPFFMLPAAMLLKHGNLGTISPMQKRDLLAFVASRTPDLPTTKQYVDLDRNDWDSIYPPVSEPEPMSTEDTISTFLDTFGSTSPKEEALLEKLIFNPTPDYSQMLEEQERENPSQPVDLADEDSQMARIDAFIAREQEIEQHGAVAANDEIGPTPPPFHEPHQPVEAPAAHNSADDSMLSESLAKIFIKQGRYERALEIITTLNLQYPKKSAYFADQMRFLQKLVKIEQLSSRKSTL